MTIKEKLSALRAIMERESLDAYIISGTDPHNSEYLPAAWKQRQWISGFTGSFGTVVVLKNEAGLWTDTRYFIQAEKQLKDSGIQMHKLRVPSLMSLNDTSGCESARWPTRPAMAVASALSRFINFKRAGVL